MSTKIRQQFRPIPKVEDIHTPYEMDSAFMYKNVIITYSNDPTRMRKYLEAGWEIVETTNPNIDDRDFTPNSKKEKLRPQMLVETTKDGHEQVLMRILKSKWEQNQIDKKNKRENERAIESQRRGDRIVRRGNEIITKSMELTENFTEH